MDYNPVAYLIELGLVRPGETLQGKLRDQLPAYGVECYCELFTPRQLLVLFSLGDYIWRLAAGYRGRASRAGQFRIRLRGGREAPGGAR